MTALSSLQSAFVQNGITTIVARDLPTALLAITQHYFVVAVVSSRLSKRRFRRPRADLFAPNLPVATRHAAAQVRRLPTYDCRLVCGTKVSLLRAFFIWLSESKSIRAMAEKTTIGKRLSSRFVAGMT